MSIKDRWLLPQGIDEVLPEQAESLELLRRQIIDLFQSWGYELVIPPMIEYLDSLLTGMGKDLDLQTFKITDQLSGRMMGIRADMTPQVSRIDAHRLKHNRPTRLCYLGPVLRTLPDGFAGSRNPLQVGAELYGHAGVESDVEVICLMLNTLKIAGISDIHLDLGHVRVFESLIEICGLDAEQTEILHDLFQRKAAPELSDILDKWNLSSDQIKLCTDLLDLNGDEDVLQLARTVLPDSGVLKTAINELEQIGQQIKQQIPEVNLNYDLAELRGYDYHTGVMFAAYIPGHGQALATGGRYDDIGQVFGRGRPATGFSMDLKSLASNSQTLKPKTSAIFAEWSDDPELYNQIQQLRDTGERVIVQLPNQQGDTTAMGCDRHLKNANGVWSVEPATSNNS